MAALQSRQLDSPCYLLTPARKGLVNMLHWPRSQGLDSPRRPWGVGPWVHCGPSHVPCHLQMCGWRREIKVPVFEMWQLRRERNWQGHSAAKERSPHPETPALPWRPLFTHQMQRGHRAPAGTEDDGCPTMSPAREGLTASTHGEELSGSDLGSQPHALPTGEVSPAESGLRPSSHLKVYEQKASLRFSTAARPSAPSSHTVCRAHLGRQRHGPSPLEPVPEPPDPAGESQRTLAAQPITPALKSRDAF